MVGIAWGGGKSTQRGRIIGDDKLHITGGHLSATVLHHHREMGREKRKWIV